MKRIIVKIYASILQGICSFIGVILNNTAILIQALLIQFTTFSDPKKTIDYD